MDQKKILQLLMLVFAIDLALLWFMYWYYQLVIVWIVNLLVFIFILWLVDFKSIINYFEKIKKIKIGSKKKSAKKSTKIGMDSFLSVTNLTDSIKINWFDEMMTNIRYYMKHWVFVLILFIFLLSLVDHYYLMKFNLNIMVSWWLFLVSLLLVLSDLKQWEIFLFHRRLYAKDYFLIWSILLIAIVFIIAEGLEWYKCLFYWILNWFVFYILALYSFMLIHPSKILKLGSVKIYIVAILLSWYLFWYNMYPQYKDFFWKNQTVWQDILNWKESVDSLPDWKLTKEQIKDLYINEVLLNWDLSTGLNAENSEFVDSLKIILSNEEKSVWDTDKEVELTGTDVLIDNSVKTDNEFDENINDNNKDEIINVKEEIKNYQPPKDLTYIDVIPYVIKKYSLSSDLKSDIKFNNIDKWNEYYDSFKTAKYHWMIWIDIDPNKKVRCKTYMVFIWLAEWRILSYKDIYKAYWEEWNKRWTIPTWCENMDKFIISTDLE